MRAFLLFLLFLLAAFPRPARAQLDAPPEPPLPDAPDRARQAPPPTRYRGVVRASPQWTQDRSFTSTRFWLLDAGNYEAQVWFRTRTFPEIGGRSAPAEFLLQAEVEIGVLPHLQIDVYHNLTFNTDGSGNRGFQVEGNQIEARIAIPRYYGQIFANPVIYLEWHPRYGQPDRGEIRLLLGGAPTERLYLAVNPYVEANLQNSDIVDAMGNSSNRYLADVEFGTTVAAGVRVTDRFRINGEMKIGADMLGDVDNRLHFVWWLGPGFILKPLPTRYNRHLKIMGTVLFAMTGTALDRGAQQVEPLLILGSQF